MFGDDAKRRESPESIPSAAPQFLKSIASENANGSDKKMERLRQGPTKEKKKGFRAPQWNKMMFQMFQNGNKNGCCCLREDTCNLDIGNARMR